MREIRRQDKKIDKDEIETLLDKAEYGVLSTVGEDSQPYGVPLNYVYLDGHIYFHCALTGHKLDNITKNSRVSFCVVGDTKVLPDQFSTQYVSAIAFGCGSKVKGEERQKAIEGLLQKYSFKFMAEGYQYAAKLDDVTEIIKIEVSHLSGKCSPARKEA